MSGLFVGIIFVGEIGATRIPAVSRLCAPPVLALVATLAIVGLVETGRRQPNQCPWLDFSLGARITLYVALFLVGLFVVFPGIWPSRDIPWIFRVPMVLFVVALAAPLKIHKTVDHGPLDETGVSRVLYLGSRLPLYLLIGVAVVGVVAGIAVSLFGSAR